MLPVDYLVEYCSRKYVVVLGVSSASTKQVCMPVVLIFARTRY
jgi:hypothetical protein